MARPGRRWPWSAAGALLAGALLLAGRPLPGAAIAVATLASAAIMLPARPRPVPADFATLLRAGLLLVAGVVAGLGLAPRLRISPWSTADVFALTFAIAVATGAAATTARSDDRALALQVVVAMVASVAGASDAAIAGCMAAIPVLALLWRLTPAEPAT